MHKHVDQSSGNVKYCKSNVKYCKSKCELLDYIIADFIICLIKYFPYLDKYQMAISNLFETTTYGKGVSDISHFKTKPMLQHLWKGHLSKTYTKTKLKLTESGSS